MGSLSDRWKGYLLALLATLSMSNVYIFSKAALNLVNLYQFGTYWFGFAVLLNFTYLLITGRIKKVSLLSVRAVPVLIIIGILETFATVLFFKAIFTVENPAVVSFLANLTPLLVTILGISFLKEHFSRIEAIGIFLTISGAFILSYQHGTDSSFLVKGAGFVFASSALYAVSITLAKKNIDKFDAGILSLSRVIFLFLFMFISLLGKGYRLSIPGHAFLNISLGSFLGPFLTALVQYTSLKYIEASRSMLIQSSKGIFVLFGAVLFFNLLPSIYQISGGLLTVAGVLLITLGKQGRYYFTHRGRKRTNSHMLQH